jgi:hypothetical protein
MGSLDTISVSAPNRRKTSKGNHGKKPVVQFKQGKLYFTTLVDIPEGAAVLTGNFLSVVIPLKFCLILEQLIVS